MPDTELVNGEKITLRPIAVSDTANIVRWRNSEGVNRFFLDRRAITAESHERWLETQVFPGAVKQFIIVNRETGNDIGSCFFKDIDDAGKKAELGIFIGEAESRGKGLGSDTVRTLTGYGFETLGLNKVYLRVLASNARAMVAYKNVGFKTDGVLRQDCFCDGRFEDVCIMSILKNEFFGRN